MHSCPLESKSSLLSHYGLYIGAVLPLHLSKYLLSLAYTRLIYKTMRKKIIPGILGASDLPEVLYGLEVIWMRTSEFRSLMFWLANIIWMLNSKNEKKKYEPGFD